MINSKLRNYCFGQARAAILRLPSERLQGFLMFRLIRLQLWFVDRDMARLEKLARLRKELFRLWRLEQGYGDSLNMPRTFTNADIQKLIKQIDEVRRG